MGKAEFTPDLTPEVAPAGYSPAEKARVKNIVTALDQFIAGSARASDIAAVWNAFPNGPANPMWGNLTAQMRRTLRAFEDWEAYREAGLPDWPLLPQFALNCLRGNCGGYLGGTVSGSVYSGVVNTYGDFIPSMVKASHAPKEGDWSSYPYALRVMGASVWGHELDEQIKWLRESGRDWTSFRYYPPYRLGWLSPLWEAERKRAEDFRGALTGYAAARAYAAVFDAWAKQGYRSGLDLATQCQWFAWQAACYKQGIVEGAVSKADQAKEAVAAAVGAAAKAYKGDIAGAIKAIDQAGAFNDPATFMGGALPGNLQARIRSGWFGPPWSLWRNLDVAVFVKWGLIGQKMANASDLASGLFGDSWDKWGKAIDAAVGLGSVVYDTIPGDSAGAKAGNIADSFGVFMEKDTGAQIDQTIGEATGALDEVKSTLGW